MQWDQIYKQYGKFVEAPEEGLEKIVETFREKGVRTVLDLGCGSGRHLVFFAERSFEVYGIDISETGISIADEWLKEKKLHANLKIGSVYEPLPYGDRFFDAVVSIRVLHHARIEDIRGAIKEIERVLKPAGLVFVTVRKRVAKRRRLKFRKLDSRTYVPLEGDEKGLVHFLFNKELLRKEFRNFMIHELSVDSRGYYHLLGEMKKPKDRN
jgi:ubiquinone/menaquinone biosynthesis C-methylase UbiE